MRKTQMINRDQIAERAFQIWESEGQPNGRDQEHWQRAEAELAETMKKMTTPPGKPAAKPAAKAPAKPAAKVAAKPASKTGKATTVKAGKTTRVAKS